MPCRIRIVAALALLFTILLPGSASAAQAAGTELRGQVDVIDPPSLQGIEREGDIPLP